METTPNPDDYQVFQSEDPNQWCFGSENYLWGPSFKESEIDSLPQGFPGGHLYTMRPKFLWTGHTLSDLKYWDLAYWYLERCPRQPHESVAEHVARAEAEAAWAVLGPAHFPDRAAANIPWFEATTYDDISAIFQLSDVGDIVTFDPEDPDAQRHGPSGWYLTYIHTDNSRPNEFDTFASWLRGQPIFDTGRMTGEEVMVPTAGMLKVVDLWFISITTLRLRHDVRAKWFPNAPGDAHYAVLGRVRALRHKDEALASHFFRWDSDGEMDLIHKRRREEEQRRKDERTRMVEEEEEEEDVESSDFALTAEDLAVHLPSHHNTPIVTQTGPLPWGWYGPLSFTGGSNTTY